MAEAEIEVGRVAEFPVGQFRVVQAGRNEVGVIRLADGAFHAVRNHCPHRGAPICSGTVGGTMLPSGPGELVYAMEGEIVRCPWHGYEFSIDTGRCLFNGANWQLRKFRVDVRGDRVFLLLA